MRTILRAAGRTTRVFLWVVKGLLLLLAVGVLVLWPMSGGRVLLTKVDRMNAGAELMDYRYITAACANGQILIGSGLERSSKGAGIWGGQPTAAGTGRGWKWEFVSILSNQVGGSFPSSVGPLRWTWTDSTEPNYFLSQRDFSAPCWLVAPVLALWPLASIGLAIRRRRKRRRLGMVGCCQRCGYDLRATPSAGGALLAVCPECGAAASASTPADPLDSARGQ